MSLGRARSDAVAREFVRGASPVTCAAWLSRPKALELLNSRSQHKTRLQRLIWRDSMPRTSTRDLTDAQWETLDKLIPEPPCRKDRRGRPWKNRRAVLNGVLWVLRTGAPWADVPDRYPSYQTCHRRFQQWVRSGMMRGVLEALAIELRARGGLDVKEAFIDGSFAPAKKGDRKSEKPSAARERRSWRLQIATGSRYLFVSKVQLPMK